MRGRNRTSPGSPPPPPACNTNSAYKYIDAVFPLLPAAAPTSVAGFPALRLHYDLSRKLQRIQNRNVLNNWDGKLGHSRRTQEKTRAFPSQIECRMRRIVSR